jgi:hypothetical protein
MSRRFTIGRERSCDVSIVDESVSRIHAEIWLTSDGALMMTDRASANGTALERAGQSFDLKDQVVLPSDQVRFGAVTLPVSELIVAIELKNPGALTPQGEGAARRPPPPPLTPLPPPLPPPPPPAAPAFGATPSDGSGMLVRCHCGAIKSVGQLCPGCHQ